MISSWGVRGHGSATSLTKLNLRERVWQPSAAYISRKTAGCHDEQCFRGPTRGKGVAAGSNGHPWAAPTRLPSYLRWRTRGFLGARNVPFAKAFLLPPPLSIPSGRRTIPHHSTPPPTGWSRSSLRRPCRRGFPSPCPRRIAPGCRPPPRGERGQPTNPPPLYLDPGLSPCYLSTFPARKRHRIACLKVIGERNTRLRLVLATPKSPSNGYAASQPPDGEPNPSWDVALVFPSPCSCPGAALCLLRPKHTHTMPRLLNAGTRPPPTHASAEGVYGVPRGWRPRTLAGGLPAAETGKTRKHFLCHPPVHPPPPTRPTVRGPGWPTSPWTPCRRRPHRTALR